MKKTKVIIADDMEPILIYLENVLSSIEEIQIVGKALNGNDLVNSVINNKPDLVITDEQMPECSGTGAINKLNEMKIRTKYVLITGYDDPLVNIQAKKLGVAKVIKKPILDDKTFIEHIKEIINDDAVSLEKAENEVIIINKKQTNQETKEDIKKNTLKDVFRGIFKKGK